MSEMSEFERKRWENNKDAADYKPIDALKNVIHEIENEIIAPSHVICVLLTKKGVSYYCAGPENNNAMIGILTKAIYALQESPC